MNDRNCWRCKRRLNIVEPPKMEDVDLTCPRCKAVNVVRYQQPTREKSLENSSSKG